MKILEKGRYVGSILHEVKDDLVLASMSSYDGGSFYDGMHYHVNAHISFVLNGGCSEKKKTSYERLPGKATFYMPGEPHQILTMNNSTHINLEMDAAFFRHYELTEEELKGMVDYTPDIQFLMLQIGRELKINDSITAASLHMLVLGYLTLGRQWPYGKTVPGWVEKLRCMLHERWNETISLEDLSAVTGVHPRTISHYFPKYFSCTLGEYMRKLKIDKALSLVKSENISLTQVAYECGFFDQSHFIRAFKSCTGMVPGEYRKW